VNTIRRKNKDVQLSARRRLRGWTGAGVWPALHALVLAGLRAAGKLDLGRCSADASHMRHDIPGAFLQNPSQRRSLLTD
jgi:hypothetical protein